MATDDDLNTTGRPAFTKDTEPGIGTYVYVDMRGNLWAVVWDVGSATWSTSPVDAVYGMPAGKLAFFGERGDLLIDAIERHAEEWRVETKAARAAAVTAAQPPAPAKSDNGGAWLALLALGLLLWEADRK